VTTDQKIIAIYYEHPNWFGPLFAELDRRGIDYTRLDAANHRFDPRISESYPILFNRMSASASHRGHANGIFYTRYLLNYLENKGARVINGERSFAIETSKAMQLTLFDSLGIDYPKTIVVNSPSQAVLAADEFDFPIVVKPNIGGRGSGIVLFDSIAQLKRTVESSELDFGPDDTALIQEFVPKRGGCIQRIETLGGKFLYGLRIYTSDENFNLCPAEVCRTENLAASTEICLSDGPANGLRIEKFDPPRQIIETVERLAAGAGLDLGGVEYLIDDRTGEPLFYDINALSNFVTDAVNIIGFDPHEKLVDFLEKEIELCATVTGSQFLAAG
jgi:glutathione synthase/RimK-type ligase-like ATP-grasp enzyme